MGFPRILLIRGGAIGDFIVTLPVLNALREQWPDAHIELACYPRVAQLALLGGLAHRAISLDRPEFARLFRLRGLPEEADQKWFGSFDMIFSFLYDPDALVCRALGACSVRHVLECDPRPTDRHASDHLASVLESLAMYIAPAIPRLQWPADRTRHARDLLSRQGVGHRPFAIHPGSGAREKNWPLEQYLALAKGLRSAGWSPFFLLGEAEGELTGRIRASADPVACFFPERLEDAADILSASMAYVGNDSGISHLAAALALDTLALFGPSRSDEWAPRGYGRVHVLHKTRQMKDLTLEEVFDAVETMGWV